LQAELFDSYALEMVESDDFADTAQLMVFIRGIYHVFYVHVHQLQNSDIFSLHFTSRDTVLQNILIRK
jgi:hypothetical protein